jgi:hypothetical protein
VLRIRGKEMLTWTEGGGQAAAVYLREHLHLDEEVRFGLTCSEWRHSMVLTF